MRVALALLAVAALTATAAPAAAQAVPPVAFCMALECHPLWPVLQLYHEASERLEGAVCQLDACLVHCMAQGCWPPGSWLLDEVVREVEHAQERCGRDPAACGEQAILDALERAAEAVQAHWPQCPLGFC